MEKDIYRKKSIERVSSPEQLNSYIKVCTPTLWVVLSAVILLLCGVIVWSIFGKLDTTIKTVAEAKDDYIIVYVKSDDYDEVKNKEITIDDITYGLDKIDFPEEARKNELDDSYLLEKGNIKKGEYIYEIRINANLPKNIYQAEIITDSVSPISFVID